MQKARALLRAFTEKDRILRVLDRVLTAQEVQIFIGAESEFAAVPRRLGGRGALRARRTRCWARSRSSGPRAWTTRG